jgi:hypothetical protein
MKNKFILSLTVFTIVFCSPALIVGAIEHYGKLGSHLGQLIYEAINENN